MAAIAPRWITLKFIPRKIRQVKTFHGATRLVKFGARFDGRDSSLVTRGPWRVGRDLGTTFVEGRAPKFVAIRIASCVEGKGVTGISNPCVWRLEMQ